jgi:NAD+ synthase
MNGKKAFSIDTLRLDCALEIEKIAGVLRHAVLKKLKKRGVVVALSGGIDSSVVGALCVHAFGKDKVFGLSMPEKDSASKTPGLSKLIAEHLGIKMAYEDITNILDAVGCYRRRDEAIRTIIPEYGPDYKCKIVLPDVMNDDKYRIFSLVVQSPQGQQIKKRLTTKAYLGILAATNFKQRIRKMMEYYYADRFNYAVTGTPNRQEYDQGFFVKLGDGAADIKPIAHLYKTQVYQIAEFLGLPEEIQNCLPTTDTYSMPQSQEEFYFSVPFGIMDMCLYGKNHKIAPSEVAPAAGLTTKQVQRIYHEIDSKRNATSYLHSQPLLVEEICEIRDYSLNAGTFHADIAGT